MPLCISFSQQLLLQHHVLDLQQSGKTVVIGGLISSRGGYSLNTSSGYYVSQDESTVLLFVTPTKPSDDIPFAKELLTEVFKERAPDAFSASELERAARWCRERMYELRHTNF